MFGRAENSAGGLSLDAEPIPDREERNPKTREEMREVNRSIPLLTNLCLAMRSNPLGLTRMLGELVTCV